MLSFRAEGSRIHLDGRLEFAAHADWRRMMLQMPDTGEVELDLGGIEDVDAAGLGLLLITQEDLGARGIGMAVVNAPAHVRRVLDVSGFSAIVTIRD